MTPQRKAEVERVRNEGWQAARAEQHRQTNPYPAYSSNRDQWLKGYEEGKAETDNSYALNQDNSDLEADDSRFSKLRGLDWDAVVQAADYLGHTGGGSLEDRLRTLHDGVKELLST